MTMETKITCMHGQRNDKISEIDDSSSFFRVVSSNIDAVLHVAVKNSGVASEGDQRWRRSARAAERLGLPHHREALAQTSARYGRNSNLLREGSSALSTMRSNLALFVLFYAIQYLQPI